MEELCPGLVWWVCGFCGLIFLNFYFFKMFLVVVFKKGVVTKWSVLLKFLLFLV